MTQIAASPDATDFGSDALVPGGLLAWERDRFDRVRADERKIDTHLVNGQGGRPHSTRATAMPSETTLRCRVGVIAT